MYILIKTSNSCQQFLSWCVTTASVSLPGIFGELSDDLKCPKSWSSYLCLNQRNYKNNELGEISMTAVAYLMEIDLLVEI
jgi:hypothetical protein